MPVTAPMLRRAAALRRVAAAAACGLALTAVVACGSEQRTTEAATPAPPAPPSTTVHSTTASSSSAAPTRASTARPAPTSPSTDPSLPGPYVASAEWADSAYGRTLEIAPTANGRRTDGPQDETTAWREVLRLAPDADSPGMAAQFVCHWRWARILEPEKPTWNIEPWRPVVSDGQMMVSGCNPGGPEV